MEDNTAIPRIDYEYASRSVAGWGFCILLPLSNFPFTFHVHLLDFFVAVAVCSAFHYFYQRVCMAAAALNSAHEFRFFVKGTPMTKTHHEYIYIYIYIYMHMYICMYNTFRAMNYNRYFRRPTVQ